MIRAAGKAKKASKKEIRRNAKGRGIERVTAKERTRGEKREMVIYVCSLL